MRQPFYGRVRRRAGTTHQDDLFPSLRRILASMQAPWYLQCRVLVRSLLAKVYQYPSHLRVRGERLKIKGGRHGLGLGKSSGGYQSEGRDLMRGGDMVFMGFIILLLVAASYFYQRYSAILVQEPEGEQRE